MDVICSLYFSKEGKRYEEDEVEFEEDLKVLIHNGKLFNGWAYHYYEDNISDYWTEVSEVIEGIEQNGCKRMEGYREFGCDPLKPNMVGCDEKKDFFVDCIIEESDWYKRGGIDSLELIKRIEKLLVGLKGG